MRPYLVYGPGMNPADLRHAEGRGPTCNTSGPFNCSWNVLTNDRAFYVRVPPDIPLFVALTLASPLHNYAALGLLTDMLLTYLLLVNAHIDHFRSSLLSPHNLNDFARYQRKMVLKERQSRSMSAECPCQDLSRQGLDLSGRSCSTGVAINGDWHK